MTTVLPPSSRASFAISQTAAATNFPDVPMPSASHTPGGVGDQLPSAPRNSTTTISRSVLADSTLGPILADPMLAMCADVVGDLEAVRVANENRLRTLTDESDYGHGLSAQNPDVARLAALVADLQAAEHRAVLHLQRVMRQHPLGAWVKSTPGVGEKQAARLLGSIRDPYWNDLHNCPRTLRQLWAYCGFHVLSTGVQQENDGHRSSGAGGIKLDTGAQGACGGHRGHGAGVAPSRRRGQKSNWNEDARKRVWLIAASCIKVATSPYRKVYDATREKYADAAHATECVRCGPKGKPAQPGTPLSAGHQHARAMRAMCKEILRDLWTESARLHQQHTEGNQP